MKRAWFARLLCIGTMAGLAGGVAPAGEAAAQEDAGGALAIVAASERPGNDDFGSALFVPLPAGARAAAGGTTTDATREPGEPRHRALADTTTLWYRLMAPTTGTMIVDTHGSQIDTVLAVYTGTALANLQRVRLNDDYDRANRYTYRTSRMSFAVVQGTTYHIVLAGKRGAEGTFRIWFTAPGAPYY